MAIKECAHTSAAHSDPINNSTVGKRYSRRQPNTLYICHFNILLI